MKKIFLVLFIITIFIAETMLLVNCEKKHQGIYGIVVERYGNWMPPIDPNDSSLGERPIIRKVCVYEYTTIFDLDSATQHDCYTYFPIDKMPKPLVASTISNEKGFYEIPLEPGKYSVFLLEDGKMYANEGDGYGGFCPVTVNAGSKSEMNLVLDHAVY